jgi:UDP-N-acetylmuramyl tripeptide synthase
MVDTHFERIADRAKAIARAVEICGDGDVILIAGKGHEDYQEFSFGTVPFDDRREARRALVARSSAGRDS